MVEGPTAKVYAMRISEKFAGEKIIEILVRSRKIHIHVEELIGKSFINSDSIGKNIILFLDNDIVIRIHLMMFGSIHVNDIGEPLLKPMNRVRLILTGNHRRLVVYNAPIIEIGLRSHVLERLKQELGPDPLSIEWNEERVYENIMRLRDEKIGNVLLDQSIIAGIGNILRNEILFRAGVNPERIVSDLSREEILRIIYFAKELSKEFLKLLIEEKELKEILYVYNRSKRSCKICGNIIRCYRQKPLNRKTFVCENCQR